ncbi:MAG: nucleotidyltransferase family protein [Bacteroidetes bacterium]|nr:nucleotidyltransferase family protein [Bacteroidota bacterium]
MKLQKPNEAIVLAGGFGTRLQTVVNLLPKPMAPVAGKPFLQYILDDLINQEIEHVILAVGYLKETIIDHFGYHYHNLKITYSIEDDPLGTGGGILQASKYANQEVSYVINGDTYFDVDLEALFNLHIHHKALLTVALKKMQKFDRYGTVEIDNDHKIIAFNEKKYVDEGLINGGIYCLDKKIFSQDLPDKFSFEKEILEKEFIKGNVFGKVFDGYFIDIGIPEDYAKAQDDFRKWQ